jgi:shikimate 5-dehydrogenase
MECDLVFDDCVAKAYLGVSVTCLYKERAFARVEVTDPIVRRVGPVNTMSLDRTGC